MVIHEENIKILIGKAKDAMEKSYSPYSKFRVGAAALGDDGNIYTGCNVENVSYGATNCAERTAFYKGVSEGCTSYKAIAVIGSRKGEEPTYCYPCGICRQVMAEFGKSPDFRVIIAKNEQEYVMKSLGELLPDSFLTF